MGRSLVAAAKEEAMVLEANLLSQEAWRILVGAELGSSEVERQVEEREGEESADVEPLPEHLKDLMQRSVSNLTEVQAGRMRRYLMQYSDVFRQGSLDLDRNGLVKHRVHTGDKYSFHRAGSANDCTSQTGDATDRQ